MRAVLALLLSCSAALTALPVGQAAPAFKVRSLDGAVWTEQDRALGAPGCVLVDFWASWCQPCLQEIPALNGLQAKYGPSGRLSVLGLSVDKGGAASLRSGAQRLGIAYAVAPVDPAVAAAYKIQGFPSAFLLRHGRVLLTLSGRHSQADFERALVPYLR
ncbi:MAG TPA: TlpA disulfide reductase family protein [bacterium]|nr:TlpA disulfide reductase family protein [bacterium]